MLCPSGFACGPGIFQDEGLLIFAHPARNTPELIGRALRGKMVYPLCHRQPAFFPGALSEDARGLFRIISGLYGRIERSGTTLLPLQGC